MAAGGEIPVYDVLNDAMEYLCKLGSNLRVRSENLKNKKIRRDKLRNSHAVQKAARKVLLICELSKKSLVNVETGVQKVLTIIEQAQSSGGKQLSLKESGNLHSEHKEKYEYIEYESRKLRIAKKVPLKHFISVKVLARSMPSDLVKKYPVYYDCKLYRLRKKNNLLHKKSISKESVNENECDQKHISQSSFFKDDKEISVGPNLSENADLKTKPSDEVCEQSEKHGESCSEKIVITKINKAKRSKKKVCFSTDNDSSQESDSKNKNNASSESNDCNSSSHADSENKKNLPSVDLSSDSENKSTENNTLDQKSLEIKREEKSVCHPPFTSPKKIKRKRSITETDSNSYNESELKSTKSGNDNIEILDDTIGDGEAVKEDKHKSKKRKKIRVLSEHSSDESSNLRTKTNTNNIILDDTIEENNKGEKSNHKKSKPNELLSDTSDKEDHKSEERSEENRDSSKASETPDTTTKPLIKCVSLSKLLKPQVLEKVVKKTLKNQNDETSPKQSDKNNYSSMKTFNKKFKNDEGDEEYWKVKRKEVKAFKAKKFAINVNKLPKLTEKFLDNHNLNKITQCGLVICEKIVKPTENLENDVNDSLDKRKTSESSISKVKNALLNDSDSDDIAPKKSHNANHCLLKTALLQDSDSDKNENTSEKANDDNHMPNTQGSPTANITEVAQRTKNALLSSSESESAACDIMQKINEKSPSNSRPESPVNNDNSNQHNNSERQNDDSKNENTMEPIQPTKNTDEVKFALLNSSDNNSPKTPADKKRRDQQVTPRSKRKHIMESMHAKKMLLTYSSSSDTEDEQLRGVLKEIKDSLLKGIPSDEEEGPKKKTKSHQRKLVLTSDSNEDDDNKAKDTSLTRDSNDGDQKKNNDTSSQTESATRKSCEGDKSGSESSKTQKQTTSDSDKKSDSSRRKIGRSKTNSASSGSSRNSDSSDTDKDINGLTNLRTLNKIRRRRRGSTSTASKSSRSHRNKKKMPKTPLINADDMLKAESSSEGGSAAESDGGDGGEDLPPVSMTPLNGGIGDLSKEDLLGESDSTSSKNDSDGATKAESDENVKSKRRKAHAISSDSEAGSSRRKDAAVKLSDFEDSEDESSEPAKKNKRKKVVDSDASAGSSDGGKKKRRRIKPVDSEGSGSDTENEGRNKHGRKNIRKVMGKNQLEEATKKAARQEKERIARIAERQKLYNNLEFDESGKPDEVVLEKVVLDFDPETKEPLIQVDRGLVKKLKPHQANGIKFMWDACFESVKRIKKDKGSGCILAHCMGLGKTLQVVSLTHTLLTHSSLTGVNRVLVVCPLSTVLNWVNEFKMWLKHAETEYEVDVYELSRFKQNSERAFQLQQWFSHGGVCVLGYEMFRNLSADNVKKFKKKMLRHFQESLVDPGPDLVVCDEGHLLKNEKTSLSQSMNRVKTLRRIVLTGTPLQNNLKEYYCMVQFVKPNLLGKYNEYLNRFVNPITNGQYTDSTEHDIKVMKRRSHVLHKMLDGAVQRRDYGVLAPFLPPKHEYVLFITLTEVQIKLYQYYLDNYSRRPLPGKSSGFLFPDFQSLQRIWTHPLVLKYNSERYEIMQQKKRDKEEEDSEGSLADFIDDDSTPDESTTEESSDDSSDMSDDSRKKSKKKKSPKKGRAKEATGRPRRGTRANPVELEEEEKANDVIEVKNENPTEWWIKLVTEDELEDMRNSSKLILLFDILRQCEAIGDKLLVFSQSLYSLDLIEHFLGKVDEATQEGRIDEKLGGHVGSWSPGIDYFRLDGSTSCENRSIWCKNFNREDNPRARLFLISTRAGGLGINLVAANRVVIFDVSWNPSHDVQSIFRVYRFGQKKPCYIYRFLAMGTMEEKIYERQVTKQAISKRVIDEQQIDRHYAENDLAELYKFEAHPPTPRPIPPLPKDRLFAEMLREHEAQIYKYHEHDSLLENKEEETLSEEERKAAWEDFENEKNRPPPAPAPLAWPGVVPGIFQQQQLAYAALASMLRKDMPNINDQQIRDMLPLIYNANPGMFGGYDYGLMQKMGEIYKYAQPGMMNPGMMNPLMAGAGAGAGAGGGMGGTSGLQYEPPWQRQQQQQQQMRLQQILQHQNQMGAKYYAGGLGSRDPVAMALQQQRAREIMVGKRGRPRGRPPLAAQPRPLPPADVVNLDSD